MGCSTRAAETQIKDGTMDTHKKLYYSSFTGGLTKEKKLFINSIKSITQLGGIRQTNLFVHNLVDFID